jgi:hypothetical protein
LKAWAMSSATNSWLSNSIPSKTGSRRFRIVI